jgi:C4-dicarboxylate transporter
MKPDAGRTLNSCKQFSLAALMEFATLCGILSALFRASGIAASILLMAMALSLAARQGLLAVAMLMAALIAADAQAGGMERADAVQCQATVILIAASLCVWYLLRRRKCKNLRCFASRS